MYIYIYTVHISVHRKLLFMDRNLYISTAICSNLYIYMYTAICSNLYIYMYTHTWNMCIHLCWSVWVWTYTLIYTYATNTMLYISQSKFNHTDLYIPTYICMWQFITYMWRVHHRIDKITGLFCRIMSLLQGSFAKETYNLIDHIYVTSYICIQIYIYDDLYTSIYMYAYDSVWGSFG